MAPQRAKLHRTNSPAGPHKVVQVPGAGEYNLSGDHSTTGSMHKPEIWRLVLQRLVPSRSEPTWADWEDYVQTYLAPEVRHEARRFYGHNDTIEAQHGGLDYVLPGVRLRLSAFAHHAQLFRVMDVLRLSDEDVRNLCRWRGTKYAKDRYERRHRVRVVDTTWHGLQSYTTPRPTVTFLDRSAPDASDTTTDAHYEAALMQIWANDDTEALDTLALDEAASEHDAWETLQNAFADCDVPGLASTLSDSLPDALVA